MKYIFSFLIATISFQLYLETPSIEDIKELESIKLGESIKEESDFIDIQTSTVKTEEDECLLEEKCIYGYELFNKVPTTFALSSDIAIPTNYVLGPGDQVKIEYFGNESLSDSQYINRTGFIKLPLLGPINLAGITLLDAQDLIKKTVNKGLIGTEVLVTLGNLRSINIYLLGEAFKPGTYTVGSLSSLTNVLFASGGVSKLGSLRNIQLKRQGKLIKTYDFYDLLLSGDTSEDIRLQDEDTIFVPLIKRRVAINGSVMRQGYFEIKTNESLSDLLDMAGLKSQQNNLIEYNTYDDKSLERNSQILEINQVIDLKLNDGDVFNILENNAAVIRTVELSGEFTYPGIYSLEKDDSLLDLINKAGGITSDAYTQGAVFTRVSIAEIEKESYLKNADNLEKSLITSASEASLDGVGYEAIVSLIEKLRNIEPLGRQVIVADPFLLKTDPKLNIKLQDGDKLFMPKRTKSISVVGEVLSPITHVYNSELSIEDYISLSGGLTDGADKDRIFIVGPNGQATLFTKRLFTLNQSETLLPGSTIVISRDPQPFDWLKLSGIITPIFSDLAIAAASISAISND